MRKRKQTMVSVGDLLMHCECDSNPLFDNVRDEITKADVSLGHCETIFTTRGNPTYVDPFCTQIVGAWPQHIKSIKDAGFDVLTLCSNHIWDLGQDGLKDTIDACDANGILHTGAGMTLEEASKPAIKEVEDIKYGFLGYNCTGPIGSWAQIDKPGCNYIHCVTAFEYLVPNVGGYPTTYSYPTDEDLARMKKDIEALRPLVNVLVVSLHKGIGFIPAAISRHEQIIAHAAIDYGADVVFGHHGHILKGVEVYKGKVIFHDLSNFMAVSDLNGKPYFRYGSKKEHRVQNKYTYEQKLAREKEFYRRNGGPFVWGPLGTLVAWPPPEIKYSIIAKCYVIDGLIEKVTFIPCMFDDDGYISILKKNTPEAENLFTYMSNITKNAYLNTQYKWEGEEIYVVI